MGHKVHVELAPYSAYTTRRMADITGLWKQISFARQCFGCQMASQPGEFRMRKLSFDATCQVRIPERHLPYKDGKLFCQIPEGLEVKNHAWGFSFSRCICNSPGADENGKITDAALQRKYRATLQGLLEVRWSDGSLAACMHACTSMIL